MNHPPEVANENESGAPLRAAPLWATLVATFFGAGRLKPGPGTWAPSGKKSSHFIVADAV